MPDLSDDDLKFVLSVDPDMDAFNKAVNQINQEIDSANVSKIKMGLQGGPGAPTGVPTKDGKSDVEQLLGAALGGGDVLGQVGGMAGEMLGGPMGAIVGAMIKKIPEIVAGPMKLVNAGLGAMSGALSDLQGPLGPVGAGLGLVSKGMEGVATAVGKISPILGPLLEQFAVVPGVLKDITTTLTSMAEKAAPGVIKQFNMAIEDAQATIGQAFIPVVELMTEATRAFSEVMANLLPNTMEVREALSPLRDAFAEMGGEMREFLKEFGPLIREVVIIHLRAVAGIMAVLAKNAEFTARALTALLAPLRLLGIGGEGSLRGATSAARQATLGSIEDYQRRLQLETFSKGTGGEMDVPTNVSSIAQAVRNIESWFQGMTVPAIVDLIKAGVEELGRASTQETVSTAQEVVTYGVAGYAARRMFGK